MMLNMLSLFHYHYVRACLIILPRSRVGHPRVAIRYVLTLWHRWSYLTKLAAQCTFLATPADFANIRRLRKCCSVR